MAHTNYGFYLGLWPYVTERTHYYCLGARAIGEPQRPTIQVVCSEESWLLFIRQYLLYVALPGCLKSVVLHVGPSTMTLDERGCVWQYGPDSNQIVTLSLAQLEQAVHKWQGDWLTLLSTRAVTIRWSC
jgi:hypothetical protein